MQNYDALYHSGDTALELSRLYFICLVVMVISRDYFVGFSDFFYQLLNIYSKNFQGSTPGRIQVML